MCPKPIVSNLVFCPSVKEKTGWGCGVCSDSSSCVHVMWQSFQTMSVKWLTTWLRELCVYADRALMGKPSATLMTSSLNMPWKVSKKVVIHSEIFSLVNELMGQIPLALYKIANHQDIEKECLQQKCSSCYCFWSICIFCPYRYSCHFVWVQTRLFGRKDSPGNWRLHWCTAPHVQLL